MMMSERRRKQNWSLNPRGKAWTENSNKFGQKLLEKMGWTTGKGLGANEDGMTEHIRVAYKNDTQGMGFKDTDDQWTEHQSNFSKLLDSLGGTKKTKEEQEESKIESLEKKSEISKARVHYRKFTRGKDLSRYSEKDLANIFGKKSLKDIPKPAIENVEKEDEKENLETKSFGVVTHNGGNMIDYFKKKMTNFKSNSTIKSQEKEDNDSGSDIERPSFGLGFGASSSQIEEKPENTQSESFETKPKQKKGDATDNFRRPCFGLGFDRYNGNESKPKSKFTSFVKATDTAEKKAPLEYGVSFLGKDKKNKKKKEVENIGENCASDDEVTANGFGFNSSNINKMQSSFMSFIKGSDQKNNSTGNCDIKNREEKKKHKKKFADEEMNGNEQDSRTDSEDGKKNKSKKIKTVEPSFVSFIKENGVIENKEETGKKKKSKKNKINLDESVDNETKEAGEDNEMLQDITKKKKKSKKDENKNRENTDEVLDNCNIEERTPGKKGKKRKSETELDVAFTPMKKKFKNFEDLHTLQDGEKIVETPTKKFKKKKDNKKHSCEDTSNPQNGLANPAFDPLYNEASVQKHHLDAIVEEPEGEVQSPVDKTIENGLNTETTNSQGNFEINNTEEKKKHKNRRSNDKTNGDEDSRIDYEDGNKEKSKKIKIIHSVILCVGNEISTSGLDFKSKQKNIEPSFVSSVKENGAIENIEETNKKKKRRKNEINLDESVHNEIKEARGNNEMPEDMTKKKKKSKIDESGNEENMYEAVDNCNIGEIKTKKKKKKSKSMEGIDNPCVEETSTMDESSQKMNETMDDSETQIKKKSKKAKKEKDSAGIENSAFDENFKRDDSIQENGESYEIKGKKRKRQEIEAVVEDGQSSEKKKKKEKLVQENKAVVEDGQSGEKKKKKKKFDSNEITSETNSSQQETSQTEQTVDETPSKSKKKKKQLLSVENPCFNNSDDSFISLEVTPNKYEVKRVKKDTNLGIVNPGLDLTSPPPESADKNGTVCDDLPVMDENIMLNVVSTPIIKKDNDKKPQRRKSVRFSDVNQSIFINKLDSPADLKKNGHGGLDNAAYDQFGNRIEENIDTLNKQLDDYQAEVENDLNEAKAQIMIGEVGDPDGENETLQNGEVKLKFKYANFGRMPPWMNKSKAMSNPKSSYRHLIKGDIVLGFKDTNMHEIKGYNEHLKECSP